MEGGDEAKLLNTMAREFPSVTAVRVKEALATVSELFGQMLGRQSAGAQTRLNPAHFLVSRERRRPRGQGFQKSYLVDAVG